MKAEPEKEIVTDQPAQLATSSLEGVAIPPKRSLGPWKVMRNRNYALLFWGQLISSAGTQTGLSTHAFSYSFGGAGTCAGHTSFDLLISRRSIR